MRVTCPPGFRGHRASIRLDVSLRLFPLLICLLLWEKQVFSGASAGQIGHVPRRLAGADPGERTLRLGARVRVTQNIGKEKGPGQVPGGHRIKEDNSRIVLTQARKPANT